MANLLDKLTGGIESLLGNPVVQGVGTAAAANLNPLIGLLAAPIIRDERERRQLDNEATRELIADSQSRRASTEGLQELLTSTEKQFVPPLGLLGVEGLPSPGSVGGFERDVPAITTPQGQQELLGLLAGSAPAAFANQMGASILGNQGTPSRVSERMRVGQELGLTGDELVQFAGGGGGGSSDVLRDVLTGLQIKTEEAKLTERNREIQAEQDARAESVNRLTSAGQSILSLETRIDSLADTGVLGNPVDLETAFGVASLAPEFMVEGVTGAFGEQMSKEDVAAVRDQAQEFDIFANDVLVNTAGDLEAIGRTDAGRSLLSGTKPNSGLGAQPNIAAAALAAQRVLDSDPEKRMDPTVRRGLEALVQRAEGGNAERQQDIADAKQALADGAPLEEILKLLRENGIDPAEIGL